MTRCYWLGYIIWQRRWNVIPVTTLYYVRLCPSRLQKEKSPADLKGTQEAMLWMACAEGQVAGNCRWLLRPEDSLLVTVRGWTFSHKATGNEICPQPESAWTLSWAFLVDPPDGNTVPSKCNDSSKGRWVEDPTTLCLYSWPIGTEP